jgi:hypothetical protein
MTLKELSTLKKQYDCKLYPNFPPNYIKEEKYTEKKESGLRKAIKDYCTINGYMFIGFDVKGTKRPDTVVVDVIGRARVLKGGWTPTRSTKGVADCQVRAKGRVFDVEIKIGRDTQSKTQKEYQQQVERSGGYYLIAKTFEQFTKEFQQLLTKLL